MEAGNDNMHIREYQDWMRAYDQQRGWDRVSPSQTLVHVMEEVGEVARLVLCLEGYREGGDEGQQRARLQEELADAATFLFKIAYQYGLDMEQGLTNNMQKAEARFPVEQGKEDMARYLERQRANLEWMEGRDRGR
ncbi:MAG: MazG nucleotide pyrophosphohydrolase domain-containing protein [Anaerolineae bacterium]